MTWEGGAKTDPTIIFCEELLLKIDTIANAWYGDLEFYGAYSLFSR